MSFDPQVALSSLLEGTGVAPNDTGDSIEFIGQDPILPSVHRLGAAAALAMMGPAVGAATLWKLRNGSTQKLSVDLREAIHGLNPHFAFQPTLNGLPYVRDKDGPSPIPHTPQPLGDGRWGVLTAHFQHHIYRWLTLLGVRPEQPAIIEALSRWDSAELEAAAADRGLAFCLCESSAQWAEREQGKLLGETPTIEVTKLAPGEPVTLAPSGRPLDGIRVLTLTHAISGPTVGRTLAEQGAEVLHLPSPNQLELHNVYNDANVGTRSAFLDMKTEEGNRLAHELARDADVIVENFRGGAADRLGFAPEDLATNHPRGVVVVSLRCYGYRGPWWDRAGHDLQGSATCGVTVSEGSADHPKFPPTNMLNDYLTGYLGATGATAALVRRATEGGSYHVSVSLTRNAMWCQSLGLFDKEEIADVDWRTRVLPAPVAVSNTAHGELRRVAPIVRFSETPGYWEEPALHVRGAARPEWSH